MKINWKSPFTYLIIVAVLIGLYFLFTSEWFKSMFASSAATIPATNTASATQTNNPTAKSVVVILPTAPNLITIPVQPGIGCSQYTIQNPYRYHGYCYVFVQEVEGVDHNKLCQLRRIDCPK